MTDVTEAETKATDSAASVGEQLKKAREAKKQSIPEVASQLRFPRDTVQALEAGQWEKMHGRTYARGYFSSYVKYLGLPHDEMMAIFELEYNGGDEGSATTQKNSGVENSSSIMPVIFIIIVAVIIWYAYLEWQKKTANIDAESDVTTLSSAESDAFGSSVVEPIGDTANSDNTTATRPNKQPSQATALDSANSTITEQAKDDVSAYFDGLEASQQNVTTVNELEVAAVESVALASLEITFSDSCWAEITNSESVTLINKAMAPNETILLNTDLPLNIWLGKASVATVHYNGEVVDLEPYTQGDVARLTLGADL